jgi:putative tryptophan/tyrosine transport system substrate-binding protein
MRRRAFIAGLGGVAVWPLVARAHQQDVPIIGWLSVTSPETSIAWIAAFRQGLNDAGSADGRNVAIEYRWGRGQFGRMATLAAELVDRRVSILVNASGSDQAARAATSTIPITAIFGGDPVRSGSVISLNRPGGNTTGVALFAFSLGAKRLELMRELMPTAKLIAVLVNPTNPDPESDKDAKEVEAAAASLGQQILIFNASNEGDFESVFAEIVRQGRADSSSWLIRSFPASANDSLRWLRAMQFLRSMNGASFPNLAAS